VSEWVLYRLPNAKTWSAKRAHLELLVADGRAQGLSEKAAIKAAIEQFGDPWKLARAMNTRGVTWRDWVFKIAAVAAWSAVLSFWTLIFMAGASGALFGTLLRWDKTTDEIMPVAHFTSKILPVSGVVVAIMGVILGLLGILPGTGQTSRHGRTLSLHVMGLWLFAPCAALAAIVSALHTLEIGLGRSQVSFYGAVLCAFSLLFSAPYIQAWRKRRLQKN
jgi:hypothetical protein